MIQAALAELLAVMEFGFVPLPTSLLGPRGLTPSDPSGARHPLETRPPRTGGVTINNWNTTTPDLDTSNSIAAQQYSAVSSLSGGFQP